MNNNDILKQLKEIRGCINHLVNLNNTKLDIECGNHYNKEQKIEWLDDQINVTRIRIDNLIKGMDRENNVKSK